MPPPRSPLSRSQDAETIETPWGTLSWRVSRALGNSATMTFGRALIRAGCENPRHRHPNCDEILHVVSGTIEHSLGVERFLMGPGDTISIPADVWHNARAIGDDEAITIICFSSADRETEWEAAR